MKLILVFFSLLNSSAFGQQWSLNEIDTTQELPYEYWFQLQHSEDSSTYKLVQKADDEKSNITLTNSRAQPEISTLINLQNLAKDSVITLFTDFNGSTNVYLEQGEYLLSIQSFPCDPFSLNFSIEKNQQIDLNIVLGLGPGLEVYQINSRLKLPENEILEIINCVEQNPKEFHNCSSPQHFMVMMHI